MAKKSSLSRSILVIDTSYLLELFIQSARAFRGKGYPRNQDTP